ncbi:phage late control D family protein [Psychrobacter aquaticus]|uniref:Putative cytoplasmic protein n=1 Tax=Psychrobacter aquaticus CMS 56 TaxID=1354303 RepID=U4T5F8_9GAMM|nr:putative cytoplasmic protein [Psychrobacter aquaticus]ERL56130.1 putative cytoplasmic protein [Psychrobacter aquaticus CMS 56]
MIRIPAFTLLYNNKTATHDIAESMIDASYVDHLSGEADELSITLADPDRLWMSDWYPNKGATLMFSIGYEGEPLLDCGIFEIDEITLNDAPNTVQIRALSAGVNDGLRTVKHVAYDDQTLNEVIVKVARQLGYSVEGKIAALRIERITQKETDLAFIKRLAITYGYAVKVIGKRLIFSHLQALNDAVIIATIDRTEMHRGWSFRDQIRTVKKEATVTRHNPKTKKTVKATQQAVKKVSQKTAAKKRANKITAVPKSSRKTKKQKLPLKVYGLKDGVIAPV